jgi:hypothetical protein
MSEIVHLLEDGKAVTVCCGQTPWVLDRTNRCTMDPALMTCPALLLAADRERIAAAAEEMADELEFDVFMGDITEVRSRVRDLLHRLAAIARGES